jgi:SSS family transporter
MLYIGVLGKRRTKDANDYFIAGRSFGISMAVLFFVASYISAGTMVGYSGFAYSRGWSLLSHYCIGLMFSMFTLQLFSRKFYNAKSVWYSTTDVFAERFEEEFFMRRVLSVYIVLNTLLHIIWQLMGVGTVLEVFLGIPYVWAIVAIGAIFIFYTAYGGQFSVAWTNVVQCTLLFLCIVLGGIWAVNRAGGLSLVNAHIATLGEGAKQGAMMSFTFNGQYSMALIVGTWLNLALTVPCNVHYQRIFFSLNSARTARSMVGFGTFAIMLVYFTIVLVGVAGTVLLPDLKNPEQVFPQLVSMMPPVFAAIAVSGIVAAIQSSIDTQLLSASTIATHDFYKNVFNKNATQQQLIKFSSICCVAFGLVAMVFAIMRFGTMMELYNVIIALNSSVVFPTMLLGLFWKRTTKQAAIFGISSGAIGCYVWLQHGVRGIPPSLVVVPLVLIGMAIISLCTKPASDATLAKFFDVRKSKPIQPRS